MVSKPKEVRRRCSGQLGGKERTMGILLRICDIIVVNEDEALIATGPVVRLVVHHDVVVVVVVVVVAVAAAVIAAFFS